MKKFFKKLKIKKIIIWGVIIALGVTGVIGYNKGWFGADEEATKRTLTAKVTKGNIDKIIEGTGLVEAMDRYEVTAIGVKGEVLTCTFEEGDKVEKDQVLYTIDSSDVTASIERAENSLEKAQDNYDDALEKIEKQTVTAPISGTVIELNGDIGDDVNSGRIAVIRNDEKMKLDIEFLADDAANMSKGMSAKVKLSGSDAVIDGEVVYVTTGGMQSRKVEIIVNNPGAINAGDKATAIVGEYACRDEGVFTYSDEQDVLLETSGEIVYLACEEGDRINAGEVLVKLESDANEKALKSARLSLDDAKTSLKDAKEKLDDYIIKAPIAGTVTTKNIKVGEKLDNTNSNTAMAIIADLSGRTFDMSIDELDIGKISVGQKVQITADAYERMRFTGFVDKISVEGTATQGVTSYPVTVYIDDEKRDMLTPGMNVTGDIIIESVKDVLRVPVSAVNRGGIVIAKTDAEGVAGEELENLKKRLTIPDGYKAVKVETGISSDSFIEIKSGLNEGDEVIIPDATAGNTGFGIPGISGGGGFGGGAMGGGARPGGNTGGARPGGNTGGANRSGGSSGGANRSGGSR